MELRNLTPFDALCFSALGVDEQEYPVVAMKVGYRLLPVDGQPGQFHAEVIDDEPLPLCTGDTWYGDEGTSSVLEESDLAPYKPLCDVIVVGQAHAPQGIQTQTWTGGIRLSIPSPPLTINVPLPKPLSPGEPLNQYQLEEWNSLRLAAAQARASAPARRILLDKTVQFTGPRQFTHGLFSGWKLSTAEPALSVPLRWEYAFGGSSVVLNPEHQKNPDAPEHLLNQVCYSNPLGRGWLKKRHEKLALQLDNPLRVLPAPQIEAPDSPIKTLVMAEHPDGDLDARGMAQLAAGYGQQPAGFGVVGRAWAPRLALAGTYDDTWQNERWPHLPLDFDFAYWSGAPADQQIEFPPPNLRIELFNLTAPDITPGGQLQVDLPGHRPFLLLRLNNGVMLPLPLLTDTLRIDTDAMTLALTHRISLPNTLDIRALEVRFETDPDVPLIRMAQESL